MKFSFPSSKQQKKNEKQQQEKVILFVCVENAGRSQIAEGFFNRKYVPKGYRAVSAGTQLPGWVRTRAIAGSGGGAWGASARHSNSWGNA